jgi:hypothetical protein
MDEYAALVEHHLRHTFDRDAYERESRKRRVNVPFVL